MDVHNDLQRLAKNVPGTVPLRPDEKVLQDRYCPAWRPIEDIARRSQPDTRLLMAQERFHGALSVLAAIDELSHGSIRTPKPAVMRRHVAGAVSLTGSNQRRNKFVAQRVNLARFHPRISPGIASTGLVLAAALLDR